MTQTTRRLTVIFKWTKLTQVKKFKVKIEQIEKNRDQIDTDDKLQGLLL